MDYFSDFGFIGMAEASLLFEGDSLQGDLETARDCRTSEFMVIPSSLTQSDNEAKSTVMAAPRSRKSTKPRASRNSRKSELEDQMEERMRDSIETRFSSLEEKMLGMFSELQRQNMALPRSSATATFSLPSVQSNTSGVCQPTDSRLDSAKKQRTVLSLENSLNDKLLDSSRRTLPQQSSAEELHYTEDDFDLEDVISLQTGQAEAKELDLESQSNLSEHVQEQGQIDDRSVKYKLSENSSEETQQVLLDMFGDDACVKKSSSGEGVLLDKAQRDILNESWRISTPSRLTAYRDSYKNSFPVHERSEEFLKVPSLDDIVEHFLIKRHSGKATFKWARSLFTAHLKEMERLAFQGQTAARMGIIISLYEQRALASLLQELRKEKPNLDAATQLGIYLQCLPKF